MKIARKGDMIRWKVENCGKINGIYEAEVAMVDIENEEYGVYCEYGNDLIPFENATIIFMQP